MGDGMTGEEGERTGVSHRQGAVVTLAVAGPGCCCTFTRTSFDRGVKGGGSCLLFLLLVFLQVCLPSVPSVENIAQR